MRMCRAFRQFRQRRALRIHYDRFSQILCVPYSRIVPGAQIKYRERSMSASQLTVSAFPRELSEDRERIASGGAGEGETEEIG